MSEILLLQTSDKLELHARVDRVDESKGAVIIVHGLHDHSGRYNHVAESFRDCGYSTLQFDLRGNGRSDGKRGYISRFNDHVLDMDTAMQALQENFQGPYFAYAHSMGALILSTWILDHTNPFRGVVYSGGLFKVNEDISPVLQKLSGVVSAILPSVPTIKLDFRALSRDPEVLKQAARDKLQYKGGVRARTGAEVIVATAALQARLEELDFPILILHGEKDGLTKYEASQLLYERSRSSDKTIKIYPGARHEVFNEINKQEVLNDVCEWMSART